MNRLNAEKRTQVVAALVEGSSINSIVRMTGVAKHTILKLLEDMGCACAAYHHRHIRGLRVRRLQCDEIWAFVGAKAKNASPEKKAGGWGDAWTWTAIDADSKLVMSWLVGERTNRDAYVFLSDLKGRLRNNRVQITTDGHQPYLSVIEPLFGADSVDFAMLHKIYGMTSGDHSPERTYSSAVCTGIDIRIIAGDPDPDRISTSYVERQNLTMRMGMRRFTRLTNAFSKKVENHAHAVSLHFMYYNFGRPHQTLTKRYGRPTTPAMAAGVSDYVWSFSDIAALLEPTA